jgi:RNA polymerase sigma-70 factor, ECF subfamily
VIDPSTTELTGALARAAAEAAARGSYGKLVAFLSARTRNVAAAEDALSDAFAAALADWPAHGVPERPEAWLLAVARRKVVDAARRQRTGDAAAGELRLIAEELAAVDEDRPEIPDERLSLMFACAHPALDPAIRAPLILQTILGFDAATIASAFLVAPTTMGQRLVRAKQKITQAGIPFRLPARADMGKRLEAVLEAIYATFTEGWSDPTGTETRRRNLAEEGIWLGRLVASLLPAEPEALGLLALMLYAEARRGARRDSQGDYIPLAQQDTATWDESLIAQAEATLRQASEAGTLGRYQIEAAIQSAHVVRRRTGSADWAAIERLYDLLWDVTQSPVVAVNRAVAIAETRGAAAALAALDAVADDPRLTEYQPYWAARADCLVRSGDAAAASRAYQLAIGLETDPSVRRFLEARLHNLSAQACRLPNF